MSKQICVFGEVLFDVFPDGNAVLGGAPFNVAWHLQAYGLKPDFISRIGDDDAGETIRQAMIGWDMSTATLQLDEQLPTGKVDIQLQQGEPSYDIVSPSAWDAIEVVDSPTSACDLLYHGSLACRHEASAQSLQRLVDSGPACLFVDVNLRAPWWDKEQVISLVRQAHWTKLNTEEFDLLVPGEGTVSERLATLIRDFELQGAILTHGSKGAEVMTDAGEHFSVEPETRLQVVDTVGAGDAFASVMIAGIVNHWPIDISLQRAQQMASAIVGQRGATVRDQAFYQDMLARWNAE